MSARSAAMPGVGVALLAQAAVLVCCAKAHSFDEDAWRHHVPIRVVERAGVGCALFPVSFELDTARLVRDGRMRADGADLRLTVAGRECPSQIEDMNTARTLVTFQIDLEPGQVREDAVLHYGNPEAGQPKYTARWGWIRPTKDGFENELLRVSYGLKRGTFGKTWGCQTEFVIKRCNENQFGGRRLPASWAKSRNDVTYWEPDAKVGPKFEIEVDGPVYKSVRFFSPEKLVEGRQRVTNLSQRVTFYRGCPFVREEYENIVGAVVDVAAPGGMRLRDGRRRNFDFVAHNFDSKLVTWDGLMRNGRLDKETRGGWTASKARADEDARYRYLADYLCNGFLILGAVNLRNGRGIGTCAKGVETAFFVDWPHERAGYSLWPDRSGRMVRHLYYVERGAEEVISRGRLLANPPSAELAPLAKSGGATP